MTLLETLSFVCGVIYFLSWSLSFYPQTVLNYRVRDSAPRRRR